MNQKTEIAPLEFARVQQRSMLVGIAGMILLMVGAVFSTGQFYKSYLFAYVFWISLPLGCFGILMLHHMVSGRWGYVIQRFLEASTQTLPLMAILFVPILIGMKNLYPWTTIQPSQDVNGVHFWQSYLNSSFFIIRVVIYFVIWIGLSFLLTSWSRTQDKTADPRLTRKIRLLSAPGLVVYVLTMTFAAVDWVMSLEPGWYSTIYGFIFIVGQVLTSFAFAVIVLRILSDREPFSSILQTSHFHFIGNLVLTFVVLWAYMAFSQWVIIWAGNLPEENSWYLKRLAPGWGAIGTFLIIAHFFVPFFILLSRRAKQVIRTLSFVAAGILVMRIIDMFWLVTPSFFPERFHISWLDVVAPIGIGGIWLAAFIRNLKGQPMLALNDPRFEHGMNIQNAGHD